MHIIYSVATCSNQVYTQLFANVEKKPAFQAQKYHRLLIEGLAAQTRVDVIATPPVNRSVMDQAMIRLPDHEEGGARYHHLPAVRNPFLKCVFMAFGTFFKTLRLADKESAVIVDCLNRVVATSALMAAKLRRVRCVGIVTDLPDMFEKHNVFFKKWGNWIIRRSTDYVVLTQAMNDHINPHGKPYVVLEGHADIAMAKMGPSLAEKTEPRVVLYAGAISKIYGTELLVRGFQLANVPNSRMCVYGLGDYVEELKEIAHQDQRVEYGGMLMNSQIIEKERQATLLVNIRPTDAEFVKYSFPSKTMEYMASGTPLLTTVLPGMPKEYHPYVYLLEEETAQGVAKKLKELFALSGEELFQKGTQAREFVLKEKNNVVQAGKILDMLENTRK